MKHSGWLISENYGSGRRPKPWQSMRTAAGRMRGPSTRALCDQLIRAAMSVPANIVEGSAHSSPRECARYLQYALASVSELEGHVLLARDLQFMNDKDFGRVLSRIVNVRRMLHGLLKTVKARCNG